MGKICKRDWNYATPIKAYTYWFFGLPFLLGASVLGTSAAFADVYEPVSLQESTNGQETASDSNTNPAVDEVLNFVEGIDTESAYFNAEEAEAAGASAETLEAGAIFNQMAAEQSGISPQAGIPIWGNYCGPRHSGGTPVDTLDSYCQAHDQCYANVSYLDCGCDLIVVGLINGNLGKMSGMERVTAIAISVYFTVSPCLK